MASVEHVRLSAVDLEMRLLLRDAIWIFRRWWLNLTLLTSICQDESRIFSSM